MAVKEVRVELWVQRALEKKSRPFTFQAVDLPDRWDLPGIISHQHQGKKTVMCKTTINRFILHDCTDLSKGLRVIS